MISSLPVRLRITFLCSTTFLLSWSIFLIIFLWNFSFFVFLFLIFILLFVYILIIFFIILSRLFVGRSLVCLAILRQTKLAKLLSNLRPKGSLLQSFLSALLKILFSTFYVSLTKDEALLIIYIFSLVIHRFPILDQAFLNGAPHMKSFLAISIITLDAAPSIFYFTYVAD